MKERFTTLLLALGALLLFIFMFGPREGGPGEDPGPASVVR